MKQKNDCGGYDSMEELYFSWWLDELKESGKVVEYQRGISIELCDSKYTMVEKQLKTKTKQVKKHLLDAHIYTCDFIAVIKPEFFKKMGFEFNGCVCYFEVKGSFDFNNMTRLFRINQKWVYDYSGKFINLVKVPDIFEKTFTPKKYLLTNKSGKERKIKFETRTLEQWVGGLK